MGSSEIVDWSHWGEKKKCPKKFIVIERKGVPGPQGLPGSPASENFFMCAASSTEANGQVILTFFRQAGSLAVMLILSAARFTNIRPGSDGLCLICQDDIPRELLPRTTIMIDEFAEGRNLNKWPEIINPSQMTGVIDVQFCVPNPFVNMGFSVASNESTVIEMRQSEVMIYFV